MDSWGVGPKIERIAPMKNYPAKEVEIYSTKPQVMRCLSTIIGFFAPSYSSSVNGPIQGEPIVINGVMGPL